MQVKQLFALTALALAGSAVLADEAPGAPLTRAQVVQSVLAARAAGTLRPAGEAGDAQLNSVQPAAAAGLTRSEVTSEVLAARAAGTLRGAGNSGERYVSPTFSSPKTRAQLQAEVLQARAAGELIPAGQGDHGTERIPNTTRTFAVAGHDQATNGTN